MCFLGYLQHSLSSLFPWSLPQARDSILFPLILFPHYSSLQYSCQCLKTAAVLAIFFQKSDATTGWQFALFSWLSAAHLSGPAALWSDLDVFWVYPDNLGVEHRTTYMAFLLKFCLNILLSAFFSQQPCAVAHAWPVKLQTLYQRPVP